MGHNAFETVYDRLRGKEPVNALPSMLSPTPGVMADQPDPAYTPRQNPLNVLGSRLMGVLEDPRNAWIGAGPVAMMAKIPRAAGGTKRFLEETVKKYDFPWSGKLYRAGETGKSPTGADFYSLDPELAKNYGDDVKEYAFPDVRKVYHVDVDNLKSLSKITGKKFNPDDGDDIAIYLEESIPHLKAKGYEGMVIEGETGAYQSGVPIEFVHFGSKPATMATKLPKRPPIVGKLDDVPVEDIQRGLGSVGDIRQAHFYEKAGDDLKGMDRPSRSFGYDQYMEMWPTREEAVKRWGDIPEADMRIAYKNFLKEQKRKNKETVDNIRSRLREGK